MSLIKPRLRRELVCDLGQYPQWGWRCTSIGVVGIGLTPMDAYQSWERGSRRGFYQPSYAPAPWWMANAFGNCGGMW